MPSIRQSTVATTRKQGPGDTGSVSLKATFDLPTIPGSLVIAVAEATGGVPISLQVQSGQGFSPLLPSKGLRDIQVASWYRLNTPAMSSLSMTMDSYRGVVWRLFEVPGIAQGSALDQFQFATGESDLASTGQTSTLAASNEWAFGVIASQYESTTQTGFTGGMPRLYEDTVPSSSNEDWERGRVSFFATDLASTAAQKVTAKLSTTRRWIGFVATFKTTGGPVKFSATNPANTVAFDVAGSGFLTVFGRLKLTDDANNEAFAEVTAVRARIGPFDYQYRLNGWTGLLIGAGTDYPVESVVGLEGAAVRISDADLPNDPGANRGLDLPMPRTVVWKIGASPTGGGSRAAVEDRLAVLRRALRPRPDDDVELIFRHPGRPLRTLYYRPIETSREMTFAQTVLGTTPFTLRAADPRLYSATVQRVYVPVAPDVSEVVTVAGAVNDGDDRAYPTIRITGPTSGPDVTRIQLVNASTNTAFDVIATLQAGAELVGDMRSRVTGGRTSVVTLNGAGKYGAWQQPRQPFYLAPDPDAAGGVNLLYLRTTPAGAPVTCSIEYRHTWSG